MAPTSHIQQICVSRSAKASSVVLAADASKEDRKHDLDVLQPAQLRAVAKWPLELNTRFAPCPLYVPPSHVKELETLTVALEKALTDIVERWWSDEAAAFPSRMPLEQHEEQLLKWMVGPGSSMVRSFRSFKGCWRPDYLIEDDVSGEGKSVEQLRICEINARFPYNGFFVSSYGSRAYAELGTNEAGLVGTVDLDDVRSKIIGLFDVSKPLHILKDKWAGADIHFVAEEFKKTTGQAVRFITPSQVRLIANESSKTGFLLYCALDTPNGSGGASKDDGEDLERIHQVSLELMQPEYRVFDFDTLCTIATCCVNDPRSIFLVHDKRMLGIVLEEIDNMLASTVLTQDDARALREGIALTTLPGSTDWLEHIRQCELDPSTKDDYLLKATRSGFAEGHLFGDEKTNEEWLALLQASRKSNSCPGEDDTSYVLQKRVWQVKYDIIRHDFDVVESFHIVGSYLIVHGEYLGLGAMRIAEKVHLAVNNKENGMILLAMTDAEGGDGAINQQT